MSATKKVETQDGGLPPSELLALDSLTLDPANARRHPDRNLAAIKGSLTLFGQRKPIVVQRKGKTLTVRAGNGTVEAARALGWKRIAATVFDEDDVRATAYAIADNRTGELAEWDLPSLAEQLKALQSQGVNLEPLGWEAHDLDVILNADFTVKPNTADLEGDFAGAAMGTTIKLTIPQREVFDAAKARLKNGEDLDDAEALVAICERFMKRP